MRNGILVSIMCISGALLGCSGGQSNTGQTTESSFSSEQNAIATKLNGLLDEVNRTSNEPRANEAAKKALEAEQNPENPFKANGWICVVTQPNFHSRVNTPQNFHPISETSIMCDADKAPYHLILKDDMYNKLKGDVFKGDTFKFSGDAVRSAGYTFINVDSIETIKKSK